MNDRREPPNTGCLLYAAVLITVLVILFGWGFVELIMWVTSK